MLIAPRNYFPLMKGRVRIVNTDIISFPNNPDIWMRPEYEQQ
jgi:hypothetical protein